MARRYKARKPNEAILEKHEQDRQNIRDLMASGLSGTALRVASGMKQSSFYDRLKEVKEIGTAVPDQPPVTIESDSLRTRLLRAIVEDGPFGDARALSKFIRKPTDNYGLHEVMHILFALNKDGLVAMTEQTRGSQKELTNIRPRAAAYRVFGYTSHVMAQEVGSKNGPASHYGGETPARDQRDATDFRNHRSNTKGGPITRRKVAPEPRQNERVVDDIDVQAEPASPEASDPRNPWTAPVATVQTWPVLEALRSRQTQDVKNAQAAELLMAAAELTGDITLLERAADLTESVLSEAEVEYLAYANAKEA